MATTAPTLKIIGVGNEWRGDDGVGLWVARRLREKLPAQVAVAECAGEMTCLFELWRGADRVLLVDAVVATTAPGRVHRFSAREPRFLRGMNFSTHGTGLAEVLELGRTLNVLPPEWVIYAIEGKDFQPGAALSAEVLAGAQKAVAAIVAEVGQGAGDA